MPITKTVMWSVCENRAVKGVNGEQSSSGDGEELISVCCLHSVGIALGREVDPRCLFFFNSIGGLILDKTVTDPNFEGMAVFTPVINGRLGRGGLYTCFYLYLPSSPRVMVSTVAPAQRFVFKSLLPSWVEVKLLVPITSLLVSWSVFGAK